MKLHTAINNVTEINGNQLQVDASSASVTWLSLALYSTNINHYILLGYKKKIQALPLSATMRNKCKNKAETVAVL